MIERSAGNADAIARIRKLKGNAQAETLTCPGRAPGAAEEATAASTLEGTYRTSLTQEELATSPLLLDEGELNDQNWGALTLRLSNGRVSYTQRNERDQFAVSGTYTTDGDVLKLQFDDYGETWGFRWSLYRGTLKLQRDDSLGPVEGPTPLLINPWRRVH